MVVNLVLSITCVFSKSRLYNHDLKVFTAFGFPLKWKSHQAARLQCCDYKNVMRYAWLQNWGWSVVIRLLNRLVLSVSLSLRAFSHGSHSSILIPVCSICCIFSSSLCSPSFLLFLAESYIHWPHITFACLANTVTLPIWNHKEPCGDAFADLLVLFRHFVCVCWVLLLFVSS